MPTTHTNLTAGKPATAVTLIDNHADLRRLADQLMHHDVVAIDTEANSLYAYHEHVCLIQISIPGHDYLIDPFPLNGIAELEPVFTSPHVEKIFHAVDYDLLMLHHDFGITCSPVFDTMWAARILGWPQVGLGNILENQFDVKMNKKFQRYDWGRRPLSEEALQYAWMDSHYLIELREIQRAELAATGRLAEAEEVFAYLVTHMSTSFNNDSDRHFWRIKRIQDLTAFEQKLLYQLFLWREQTAERLDRPTVKVVGNDRLKKLAQVRPKAFEDLISAGLTSHQARRFGTGILRALWQPNMPSPPSPPNSEKPPASVMNRYRKLKTWRKDVALKRGVDSDVILPNAILWQMAKTPPTCAADLELVDGLGPWHRDTYGQDLLRVLNVRAD